MAAMVVVGTFPSHGSTSASLRAPHRTAPHLISAQRSHANAWHPISTIDNDDSKQDRSSRFEDFAAPQQLLAISMPLRARRTSRGARARRAMRSRDPTCNGERGGG